MSLAPVVVIVDPPLVFTSCCIRSGTLGIPLTLKEPANSFKTAHPPYKEDQRTISKSNKKFFFLLQI
jgi:hypothetical protein